jgi:hypothetical protein
VNPLGLMGFGLTAIWFLVIGLFFLRGVNQPRLLGVLALVAFADLAVGFAAALAGNQTIMLGAALSFNGTNSIVNIARNQDPSGWRFRL